MPRRSGLGRREAAHLGPVRGGRHREHSEAAVHPDKPAAVVGGMGRVAALDVNVWSLDVEADIPTGAVSADRGEQHLGARRHHRLPGVGVEVPDRAEQPPQHAGVVVHPDHADGRQAQ
jgi:hypothetical protein